MQAKGTATSAHAFNRLWDIARSGVACPERRHKRVFEWRLRFAPRRLMLSFDGFGACRITRACTE